MKTVSKIILVLAILACRTAIAQDVDSTKSQQLFEVTKNDGSKYIGKILSDDGREILLETEALGKIYITKSEIKSIVKIENAEKDVIYGELRTHGPFTTRYAFTTNALPIVKGENYAMVNLYGPEVHFAVSDHFNVGIMSTWIASPMVLAMKYSIKTKNEKVNVSLGTLFGSSGYLYNFRGFGGLHFGNITYGTRGNNITFSAGYAYMKTGGYTAYPSVGIYYTETPYYYSNYSDTKLAPINGGPIFSVAGIAQVGSSASFVFDSMIGVFTSTTTNVQTTTITPEIISYTPTYTYTPGLYRHDVTESDRITTAMFLMPGMRFQKTEKTAFQISLAGVSMFRGKGWTNKNTTSFPFPMCSWFFKF